MLRLMSHRFCCLATAECGKRVPRHCSSSSQLFKCDVSACVSEMPTGLRYFSSSTKNRTEKKLAQSSFSANAVRGEQVASSANDDETGPRDEQDERDVFGNLTEEFESSASNWNDIRKSPERAFHRSNSGRQYREDNAVNSVKFQKDTQGYDAAQKYSTKDLRECTFDEDEVVDKDIERTVKKYGQPKASRRNERDVFGSLANENEDQQSLTTAEKLKHLDLEYDEERPQRQRNRIRTVHWYARQIERLAKRRQIYEAIEMLETRMIKEDRVEPEVHHFSALIGGLGRVGYSRKAYKMYNLMKKLQIEPDGPTYTGLFNSFANTPKEFKAEALEKAKRLHNELREKEIDLNVMTYNAMVKVYGMLGEVVLAFSVVDEMEAQSVWPDAQTYSCLLIACISDKDAGFKHAIEVWRRYRRSTSRRKRLRFDVHLYNLLLRSCRDCGVGGPEFAQELVKLPAGAKDRQRQVAGTEPQKLPAGQHQLQLEGNSINVEETAIETVSAQAARVPNILNPDGYFGDIVRLENLDIGTSRLALLGGPAGVLSHMHKDNVKPDVKTFTLLLDLVPSTEDAEHNLLRLMEHAGQKPDLDLLNLMIRRCNLRGDSESAAEVLALVGKLQYQPTLMTFGCLAMGCRRFDQGRQLLDDMDDMGVVPNAEIFNILAYQSHNHYVYKCMLMTRMEELRVAPEDLFIRRMEESVRRGRQNLVKLDQGELVWPERKEKTFRKTFKQFMNHYKPWLLRMKIAEKTHPWDSYKNPPPVDEDKEEETFGVH